MQVSKTALLTAIALFSFMNGIRAEEVKPVATVTEAIVPSSKTEANSIPVKMDTSTVIVSEKSDATLLEETLKQADNYLYGEGVETDFVKASQYYQKAVDLGSPKAMLRLASLYKKGLGVAVDISKAFELTQSAANLNFAPAQCALAELYLNGSGIPQNQAKALEWLQKAFDNHYDIAGVMLSELLIGPQATKEDIKKADAIVAQIHANATPQTLFAISYAYAKGSKVAQDEEKASMWAGWAAEKNEPNATYWLGEYYWKKNEHILALDFFQQAAQLGLTESALVAGRLFRDGASDMAPNHDKAVYFLEKASNLLNKKDHFYLVTQYLAGSQKVRNLEKANYWFDIYVKQTSIEEVLEQSQQYWTGEQVRRNYELAGLLALSALLKGDRDSRCEFALKLALPQWTKHNATVAYSILNQCILDHPQEGKWKQALNELERLMTAQEVRNAQAQSSFEALENYLKETQLKF